MKLSFAGKDFDEKRIFFGFLGRFYSVQFAGIEAKVKGFARVENSKVSGKSCAELSKNFEPKEKRK